VDIRWRVYPSDCHDIARSKGRFERATLGPVGDDARMSDLKVRDHDERGGPTEANDGSKRVWRPLWRPGVDEPAVSRGHDPVTDAARGKATGAPSETPRRPHREGAEHGPA
jgi:hypothetical protein